ncbi:MAG TPA: hypothetical protein VMT58_01585 [Candidatus Binataceae bacterium]|nr:hypothetical protein [Candidatus Binataceae bacterium]
MKINPFPWFPWWPKIERSHLIPILIAAVAAAIVVIYLSGI